jgi:energy-converting hydrogenase Eha subunit C
VPVTFTLIVFVVAPVFHLILPAQPAAVIVADSPLHKLFVFVLMNGAAGFVPVLITIALLDTLSPQVLLHVAV